MPALDDSSVRARRLMSLAVPNPTGYVLQPGGAPLSYGWLAALCTAAGFFRGGHQG
jgi:hypothetical protein